MKEISIGNYRVKKNGPFTIIAGPCVIESLEHTMFMAKHLKEICDQHEVRLIFKASFDKANRSSIHSYRGPGMKEGLNILARVKKEFGLPVTSDIHLPSEAKPASQVLDLLQIPAFLCRQTDLLIAASKTNLPINCKKGQFMAPEDMRHVITKCHEAGNKQLILTERGSTFGYHNLIVDMTCIQRMQKLEALVCFDASHSVQKPSQLEEISDGKPAYTPTLACASLAAGANLLFFEVHNNPASALSDAKSQLSLSCFKKHLGHFKGLYNYLLEAKNEMQNV